MGPRTCRKDNLFPGNPAAKIKEMVGEDRKDNYPDIFWRSRNRPEFGQSGVLGEISGSTAWAMLSACKSIL
jgi:hypothetical protein